MAPASYGCCACTVRSSLSRPGLEGEGPQSGSASAPICCNGCQSSISPLRASCQRARRRQSAPMRTGAAFSPAFLRVQHRTIRARPSSRSPRRSATCMPPACGASQGQTLLTVDSWWHPLERAAGYALQQLASLSEIPDEWQPLRARTQAILQVINRSLQLPVGCIHGDCWTGNAIRGPDGQIRLIDWDAAGRGALILDVGALLGDCFVRTAQEVVPDTQWVTTVVDTYRRYRTLTGPELELLPEAIQFGPAFRAAIRFSLADREGWSDGLIRGLRHEQARLAASAQIARLATAQLLARN
jgi:hypothetical protein